MNKQTKVITSKNVRFSYANLLTPKSPVEGAEPVRPRRLRGTYRPRRGSLCRLGAHPQRQHHPGGDETGVPERRRRVCLHPLPP